MKYPTDAQGGVPNCGVVAVATITGKTVGEVFQYMADKYNMHGNWKGRTSQVEVMEVLREYGFTLIQKFIKGENRGPQLQKQCFASDTIYLVWTTGHVQVVYNELVYDQSGCFSMEDYWGRRKYIIRIVEVTK